MSSSTSKCLNNWQNLTRRRMNCFKFFKNPSDSKRCRSANTKGAASMKSLSNISSGLREKILIKTSFFPSAQSFVTEKRAADSSRRATHSERYELEKKHRHTRAHL